MRICGVLVAGGKKEGDNRTGRSWPLWMSLDMLDNILQVCSRRVTTTCHAISQAPGSCRPSTERLHGHK